MRPTFLRPKRAHFLIALQLRAPRVPARPEPLPPPDQSRLPVDAPPGPHRLADARALVPHKGDQLLEDRPFESPLVARQAQPSVCELHGRSDCSSSKAESVLSVSGFLLESWQVWLWGLQAFTERKAIVLPNGKPNQICLQVYILRSS